MKDGNGGRKRKKGKTDERPKGRIERETKKGEMENKEIKKGKGMEEEQRE